MDESLIAVLDVGKTLAKLSLWTRRGEQVAKVTRPNRKVSADAYRALDVEGVQGWLASALSVIARKGSIGAIIPVGHGAAAVVVRDGKAVCLPMDYENPIPREVRTVYEGLRDPFEATGSPALGDGLNLGAQLHYLEILEPGLLSGNAKILLWPQYWAWVLSGVAASEVTSLGCHSDLWNPTGAKPSALAMRRRWAAHLPPLRRAGDALGNLTPEWAERTRISPTAKVHCGLHDSNAALLAARGFAELRQREATVVSTGTWFIAMRTTASGVKADLEHLSPSRDCIVNVDAEGELIPSSRFMGGREIERLIGTDSRRIDIVADQQILLGGVNDVVAAGTMVLPTFAPGAGPFPTGVGRWVNEPEPWRNAEIRVATGLYTALVTDVALDLIGARDRIVVEGRFAEAQIFTRALASLRPRDTVFASGAHNDVSFGALRLIEPNLVPASKLALVEPLSVDLRAYKARWRELSEVAGTLR